MEVRLNSTLRGQAGRRSFPFELPENAAVRAALAALQAVVPNIGPRLLDADERLQPTIIIFRNGRNIEFFDGLDTVLDAADVLDIYPKTGAQRAFVDE